MSKSPKNPFNSLPDEMYVNITKNLDPSSLISLSRTDRRGHNLAFDRYSVENIKSPRIQLFNRACKNGDYNAVFGYLKQIYVKLKSVNPNTNMTDILSNRRYDKGLLYASKNGHTKIVKLLLAAGANVHSKHNRAIENASENGHTDIVVLLLLAGANLHIIDDLPLKLAVINNHINTVRVLLNAGANVNTHTPNPLGLAISDSNKDIIKLLLRYGANVNVRNVNSALRNNRRDISQILMKYLN